MSNRAGRNLQVHWRWNDRPLRVRISKHGDDAWRIAWERWFAYGRRAGWEAWRAYCGVGTLRSVITRYRFYASEWRGFE